MTLQPGTVLSHYRLDRKIGEGGMGMVFQAWDQRLERPVALKVISERLISDPAARHRFLREARTASALNHPNICVIHEVDEAAGLAYIVMEWVEGNPLSALIPEEGLPVEKVLRLGIQIADAVAHAHERGIIHRDLKSANVVVTPEGRAKVLDFGLAKRREGEEIPGEGITRSFVPVTGAGVVQGTLHYLPPEVLRGLPADSRGDLWALGVMLYEMAAGHLPFQGRTPFEVSSAILRGRPAPLSRRLPPPLRSAIRRCLAGEPGERIQKAEDLRSALEAVPSRGAAPSGTRRPRAGARRPRARKGSIRTLAVLPLENLSGDPTQDYFADGMTESLIASMARIGSLRVISRTSVMLYKGVRKPLPEIARELKADAVVEGSVLRLGDRVRITAQLIRAETDEHLWAESYDRDLCDILSLQSEVARAVAREVQASLTPREEASLARTRAVDPAAYEAYLRGRHAWNKRTTEGLKEGIGFFQQAIEKDPTYALAHAGLADCFSVIGWHGALPPRDSFGRAKAAVLKALELESDLAEAHASLAYVLHHYDWDWAGAGEEYRKCLALNPAYPTGHHWNALLNLTLGRTEEAISEMEKAADLDPLSQIIMAAHGFMLYLAGKQDRAVAHFRRSIEAHPGFWVGYAWLGLVLSRAERHAEAVALCERASGLCGDLPLMAGILGHVRAKGGDRENSRRALEVLRERSRERYVMPYALALIHAGLDETEGVLECLEKAVEERGNLLCYLGADPVFDPFRSHPRFQEIHRRIGLPLPSSPA